MAEEYVASPELHAVKRDAEAMGFMYGMDFFVAGIPSLASSETIDFAEVDGEYSVTYSDMGHNRDLVRTSDLAAAREVFFDHLTSLAGPRGRGPRAGQPIQRTTSSDEEGFELLKAQGHFPADMTWQDVLRLADERDAERAAAAAAEVAASEGDSPDA